MGKKVEQAVIKGGGGGRASFRCGWGPAASFSPAKAVGMRGETVISTAERVGVEPKTYRLMLMETIERREWEVGRVEQDREKIASELRACEEYRDGLMEEILSLKSKLVKEYMVAGEKVKEG